MSRKQKVISLLKLAILFEMRLELHVKFGELKDVSVSQHWSTFLFTINLLTGHVKCTIMFNSILVTKWKMFLIEKDYFQLCKKGKKLLAFYEYGAK